MTEFYRGQEALSNFVTSELTEGVVLHSFCHLVIRAIMVNLPTPKQHPITRGITDIIPSEIREGGDRGVPIVVPVPNKPAGRSFVQIAEMLRGKQA